MRLLASLVLWSMIVPSGPQAPSGVHRSGRLRVPSTMALVLPLRGTLPARSPADAPSVGLHGEEEDISDGDAFSGVVAETLPGGASCRPLRPDAGCDCGDVSAALRPVRLRC